MAEHHHSITASLSEHEVVHESEKEKLNNSKWTGFTDRLVQVILLAFFSREVNMFRYDTALPYYFMLFALIVLVSFIISTKLELRLASGNSDFRQLILLFAKLANLASVYFTFMLVTLFASRIQPLTDNMPWNFSRLILPFIIVLFVMSIPLLIDLDFYQPIIAADHLHKERKHRHQIARETTVTVTQSTTQPTLSSTSADDKKWKFSPLLVEDTGQQQRQQQQLNTPVTILIKDATGKELSRFTLLDRSEPISLQMLQ